MEKFISERIAENKELFSKEELKILEHNFYLIKKVVKKGCSYWQLFFLMLL